MLIKNNTQNAYLVARLKSLRAEFLDSQDYERMIEAQDAERAWQVLNETAYAPYLGEAKNTKDFDIVLNAGLRATKEEIVQLYSPAQDLRFLWLKYDFLNVKSLLKSKQVNSEVKLNNLGEIDPAILKAVILEGQKHSLPYHLGEVIGEVLAKYEKDQDPQEIDFRLDQKYLEIFGRLIRRINSKLLIRFLRREIDLFNVKTYFRFLGKEENRDAYVTGGFIAKERFSQATGQGLIEGVQDLEEKNLLKHLEEQAEKEGVIALEQEAQNILYDLIQPMQGKILGIDPVFAFWQAKVLETKTIHRIMTLKNAGLDPTKIHQLVGI